MVSPRFVWRLLPASLGVALVVGARQWAGTVLEYGLGLPASASPPKAGPGARRREAPNVSASGGSRAAA